MTMKLTSQIFLTMLKSVTQIYKEEKSKNDICFMLFFLASKEVIIIIRQISN